MTDAIEAHNGIAMRLPENLLWALNVSRGIGDWTCFLLKEQIDDMAAEEAVRAAHFGRIALRGLPEYREE